MVVYFAYSYTHSNLANVDEADADPTEEAYKPPIAALIGVFGVVALTIWQVEWFIPKTTWLDTVVRLFAWITTGLLVIMLMYGKSDKASKRSTRTRNLGLALSVINLAVWAVITYWFFIHYAELHV